MCIRTRETRDGAHFCIHAASSYTASAGVGNGLDPDDYSAGCTDDHLRIDARGPDSRPRPAGTPSRPIIAAMRHNGYSAIYAAPPHGSHHVPDSKAEESWNAAGVDITNSCPILLQVWPN